MFLWRWSSDWNDDIIFAEDLREIAILFKFSVAKATLEVQMSAQDAVILKQGCGYIQKDVVI